MNGKPLIILQARLNSSRYPGKILALIDKVPSIVYQYRRVRLNDVTSNIVVAIPDTPDNDQLYDVLEQNKIPVFRGHPTNVIRRFIDCAYFFSANTIVRINGDCPLISPTSINKTVVTYFESENCNYASTILDTSFPLGEHCECFELNSLVFAEKYLRPSIIECEHVTPIIYNNRHHFKCLSVTNLHSSLCNPDIRLCIDYPEDLVFIHALLDKIMVKNFDLYDIIRTINLYPELVKINRQFIKDRVL